MQRIFHLLLFIVVMGLLNGCFFIQNREVARWEIEPEGSTSFALSRDGRFALLYSNQHHLLLWDLFESKQLTQLGEQDPEGNTVSHIRISDNSRYAITATQTNFAVWDLAYAQATGLWSITDGLIRDVDVASNGEKVLLGLSNGKAIYVNLVTGRRLEFLAHQEKVNSIALSPNGRYALTGGNDHFAYLWDTQSGQILQRFEHQQRVKKVALQRDGKFAFTSDVGNQARIWSLQHEQQPVELQTWVRQLIFSSARFSDDGAHVLTGTPAGKVMVWDASNGALIEDFEVEPLKDTRPPRAIVYDATFDLQQRVISATSAGIAQAWQLENGYDR